MVWGIISFLVAKDTFRTFSIWRNYFYGLITYLFTYRYINSAINIRKTIIALIVFALLLGLIEIRILIELGGLSTGLVGLFLKKNLMATSWGKSNYLATFYVLIIPFTIGYYLSIESVKKKVLIAFALFFLSSKEVLFQEVDFYH